MTKFNLIKISNHRSFILWKFQIFLVTITSVLVPNTNANPAQQLVLTNDIFQSSVSIVEFNQFARSGKSSLIPGIYFNVNQKASTLVATGLPLVPELDIINWINPTYFTRLANNNQPNALGDMGYNQQGYISVVFQRNAIYPIIQGLLNSDLQQMSNGIHSLEYAFNHQNLDGSFQLIYTGTTPGDLASSASFFFSELGHILLLIQNYNWSQNTTQTAELQTRLDRVKTQAYLSLNWLITQKSILKFNDVSAANRLFFDANAYYLTGRALGRSDALQVGQNFARLALSYQSSAGYFLEKGGYDSSYQGVSLLRALILYANLEDGDTSLRQDLWSAIVAGVNWELTRILPTGEVSTDGNTRVFPGGEQFLGQEKKVAYTDIVLAFYYYYQLSGDTTVKTVANNVLAYYTQLQ